MKKNKCNYNEKEHKLIFFKLHFQHRLYTWMTINGFKLFKIRSTLISRVWYVYQNSSKSVADVHKQAAKTKYDCVFISM